MPFPVTYLLDQLAPSETFIRRELDHLRCRDWPVVTQLLKGGDAPLKHALLSCPKGFRMRFFKAACVRIAEEFFRAPGTACRILKRLPQAADLAKKVAENGSQLVHAHFAGITADLASIVARTLGLPWTCSVHAHDVFTVSPHAINRRLRTAKGVTACSERAAKAVADSGIPASKVALIHHGVPLSDFRFCTCQPSGVIFTAGRLEAKKGVDTLIRACSLLRDRGVHFTCVIAGSGAMLDELKHLTESFNLGKSVVFVGWQSQDETRSHLKDAAVLALPSRRMPDGDSDGIANILVEALALGTPVVTTTASSASEVIEDSANGLLVPPDDPVRLADALATALGSKELRIRLAQAGRKTAEAFFDGAQNIQQLEAFFSKAVTAAPVRRPTPSEQGSKPRPIPPPSRRAPAQRL